jgi:hypothetical protein
MEGLSLVFRPHPQQVFGELVSAAEPFYLHFRNPQSFLLIRHIPEIYENFVTPTKQQYYYNSFYHATKDILAKRELNSFCIRRWEYIPTNRQISCLTILYPWWVAG